MKLRLHFVVDPMGWFCISTVLFIWFYNTLLIPKLVLFPHYAEGHIPAALVACYYLASLLCISALLRASTADPGKLAQDPKIPLAERDNWELCNKCNMMRPKRSHHCSRCGHCVRRMDHHCPWINNCVGEDNHWLFLQLCFYTQVLSLYTLVLDFCQYYYFQPLSSVDREDFAVHHELALIRVSCFMGLIMFGGMGGLFYSQVTGILAWAATVVAAIDGRGVWHSLEDPLVPAVQEQTASNAQPDLPLSCVDRQTETRTSIQRRRSPSALSLSALSCSQ